MTLSDSESRPAEAIVLGQPLSSTEPTLDAKEGKVDSSNSVSNRPAAEGEELNGLSANNGDDRTTLNPPAASNTSENLSHPLDPEVERPASQQDFTTGQSRSTSDAPSQSRQSSDKHLGGHSGSQDGTDVTREMQAPGEKEQGSIDPHNVNALLNLPPPLPFDLKVSNLWVGVPHRGPSS